MASKPEIVDKGRGVEESLKIVNDIYDEDLTFIVVKLHYS